MLSTFILFGQQGKQNLLPPDKQPVPLENVLEKGIEKFNNAKKEAPAPNAKDIVLGNLEQIEEDSNLVKDLNGAVQVFLDAAKQVSKPVNNAAQFDGLVATILGLIIWLGGHLSRFFPKINEWRSRFRVMAIAIAVLIVFGIQSGGEFGMSELLSWFIGFGGFAFLQTFIFDLFMKNKTKKPASTPA